MSEGYGLWKLLPKASEGCELGEHQTGWVPWTKAWSTWSLSFSHDTKGSEIPEMCGIYKAKPKAMMNCLTQETNHMNRAEGAKLSKAGRAWTMPSGVLDARPGAVSRKGLSFLAIVWESGYLFCAVRYQKYKTYFWVLHRLLTKHFFLIPEATLDFRSVWNLNIKESFKLELPGSRVMIQPGIKSHPSTTIISYSNSLSLCWPRTYGS